MDFFYREKPWYAGQFVRKITPKIKLRRNDILFFTVILNSLKQLLLSVLVRNVDNKFLTSKIHLPILQDGNINFEFIDNFIAELEAERLAELEAYLSVAGLKDYNLTEDEEKITAGYDKIQWGEFLLSDLFERVKTKKLNFKAEDLPRQAMENYTLPCLTSSFNNQGLNYFAPRNGATILKDVISIPSNSDVYRAYFQSNEFTVLSDAYAIRWLDTKIELKQNSYLFAVQCINKVTDLPIYSYKNKLGGWNVVKDKVIQLPVRNGKLDNNTMETLISALKKLIVKDMVLYTNEKIVTIKTVVNK